MQVKIESTKGSNRLYLNGQEISRDVRSAEVSIDVNKTPILTLVYACYDQLTIEGEMEVHHICPKSARK